MQSVAPLNQEPEVPDLMATVFCFSFRWLRRVVVSYWQKYVHNRLEGLSLPRKSAVRLTDHPDMTLAVYPGCKNNKQQHDII